MTYTLGGLKRLSAAGLAQVFSAATNFLLSILVARVSTPADFGAFSIVLLTWAMALGLQRAWLGESLLLADDEARAAHVATALRVALGFGATASLILVIVASAWSTGAPVALAFAVGAPVIAVHDMWRYAGFCLDDPRHALRLDVWWLLSLLGITFVLHLLAIHRPATLVIAWSVAAGISMAVARAARPPLPAGENPSMRARVSALHAAVGRTSTRLALEFIAGTGAGLALLAILSHTAGLAEVGAVRAAQLLFTPLTVLVTGFLSLGLSRRSDAPNQRRSMLRVHAGVVAVLMAAGLILAAVPPWIGRMVLGANWAGASSLLTLTTLERTAYCLSAASLYVLRTTGRVARATPRRLSGIAVGLAGGAAGAILAGGSGYLVGVALGSTVAAVTMTKAAALRRTDD